MANWNAIHYDADSNLWVDPSDVDSVGNEISKSFTLERLQDITSQYKPSSQWNTATAGLNNINQGRDNGPLPVTDDTIALYLLVEMGDPPPRPPYQDTLFDPYGPITDWELQYEIETDPGYQDNSGAPRSSLPLKVGAVYSKSMSMARPGFASVKEGLDGSDWFWTDDYN